MKKLLPIFFVILFAEACKPRSDGEGQQGAFKSVLPQSSPPLSKETIDASEGDVFQNCNDLIALSRIVANQTTESPEAPKILALALNKESPPKLDISIGGEYDSIYISVCSQKWGECEVLKTWLTPVRLVSLPPDTYEIKVTTCFLKACSEEASIGYEKVQTFEFEHDEGDIASLDTQAFEAAETRIRDSRERVGPGTFLTSREEVITDPYRSSRMQSLRDKCFSFHRNQNELPKEKSGGETPSGDGTQTSGSAKSSNSSEDPSNREEDLKKVIADKWGAVAGLATVIVSAGAFGYRLIGSIKSVANFNAQLKVIDEVEKVLSGLDPDPKKVDVDELLKKLNEIHLKYPAVYDSAMGSFPRDIKEIALEARNLEFQAKDVHQNKSIRTRERIAEFDRIQGQADLQYKKLRTTLYEMKTQRTPAIQAEWQKTKMRNITQVGVLGAGLVFSSIFAAMQLQLLGLASSPSVEEQDIQIFSMLMERRRLVEALSSRKLAQAQP